MSWELSSDDSTVLLHNRSVQMEFESKTALGWATDTCQIQEGASIPRHMAEAVTFLAGWEAVASGFVCSKSYSPLELISSLENIYYNPLGASAHISLAQ